MRSLFLFIILSLFFPSLSFAHSEVQVIEMTKEGFEPQSITIHENSTVIFINRDVAPRWPASNTHPSHALYPEFDPKKAIQPGNSWPFKPKKGTWQFHDHLFPHFRGSITVAAEASVAEAVDDDKTQTATTSKKSGLFYTISESIAQIFKNIQEFFTPKQKFQAPTHAEFKKLSADKQMEVMKQLSAAGSNPWEYLVEAYKSDNGAAGVIHDLAHYAGNLLYTSHRLNGVSFCTQEFAFGCYHGLLDEAFAKNLDQLLEAEQACLKLDSSKNLTGPVASCIHGIGHGVASYYLTNDLTSSLQTCKKLTAGSEYCTDGVFMEFMRNAPDSFYRRDDPLYPCNQFENDDMSSVACGRYQPSLLINRFNMSFTEAATLCGSAKSISFKQACFSALGFTLASSGNVAQVTAGCQSISNVEHVASCTEAAAGEMVFQQIPDWFSKSNAVCLSLPSASQKHCQQHIQTVMHEYNREPN